jgi:hypothetical protein
MILSKGTSVCRQIEEELTTHYWWHSELLYNLSDPNHKQISSNRFHGAPKFIERESMNEISERGNEIHGLAARSTLL